MADPVSDLEQEFRGMLGVGYGLGVCSGTGALLAALLAFGPEPGDEIIIGAYGWPQLAAVPRALRLRTRFVDCDASGRMTEAAVRDGLTPRTVAVVVCHLFGNPSDARAVRQLADAAGIAMVEDCSQALLARQAGTPVGRWGHIGFASIGRGKMLSGGEGGLVWTDERSLFRRVFALTQHPDRAPTERLAAECLTRSLSLRMHPHAAEAALRDLASLPRRVAPVSAAHEKLRVLLSGTPGIRLPEVLEDAAPAWTHFVFQSSRRLETVAPGVLADTRPAYLLAEGPEFPNAMQFDATAHFVDSGRSWEHVSDQDLRSLAEAIKKAACAAEGGSGTG